MTPKVKSKVVDRKNYSPELYYYYSYSFADSMVPDIIQRILRHKLSSINGRTLERRNIIDKLKVIFLPKYKRYKSSKHLLTLGSIFHHAKSGDIIWGTGFNPRWQNSKQKDFWLDIRAVRGPLTKEYVINELGLPCPEVYGDPALLLPILFPQMKAKGGQGILILAQHNDEHFLFQNEAQLRYPELLFCQRINKLSWNEIVERILKADYVISSSLHGIIIAEAFGIPSRWWHSPELPSSKTEYRFKFNDYYLATGRDSDLYANTVEEAKKLGPLPGISGFDPNALIKSFPWELYD